ncbi:MAG: hypothetical protein KBT48_11895, partial [Firmicutes bacterium]|nr:hypothetical protein [Bacillota bacterium]
TFFMSMINGFFYLAGFVALQYNIQKNGLVYSSMFMKLGIMIPILLSFFVYREIPTLFQIIGLILALSMIIFMNYTDQSIPFLPGLILLLVLGGSGDAMSKVFQMTGQMSNSAFFLFYTFFFAFVLCFLFMKYKKQTIGKEEMIYGLCIGIPNYFSAKFLLFALTEFPSIIVYPTYSILTICILGLAGIVFFKEKVEKRTLIAMIFMLVAIGFLNM